MTRTDGMQRDLELHRTVDAERLGRVEFVAYLTKYVADMRKSLAAENQAVRAAWFGPTRADQAMVARIKAAEVAEAARIAEATEAARVARVKAAEVAEATRIAEATEAARAARIKAAEAPSVSEVVETDRINAATNQARKAVASITEALKDALTRSNKKLDTSKVNNKSEKEKRDH